MSISIVAIIGYLFHISEAYTWDEHVTIMAFPTSVLLLLASINFNLDVSSLNNKKGFELAPIRILFLGFLISFLTWKALNNNEAVKITHFMHEKNDSIQSTYINILDNYFNALGRFDERMSDMSTIPNKLLLDDAMNYSRDYNALEAIYYIDQNKTLTLVSRP